MISRESCKIGMNVSYFPPPNTKPELGVITELKEKWAMVLYEGDQTAKATYYSDLILEENEMENDD